MSHLHKNKEYFSNADLTLDMVQKEMDAGLSMINKIDQPIITFFGSHRIGQDQPYYQHAKQAAFTFGKNGYAIMSGGGPGIMHAANSGATEASAPSLGLKAKLLPGENVTDPIFTEEHSFHFLFIRRFLMSIKSEALIFYPGGYGTLNELFEYVVLMQTHIVDTVPIICVNKDFWQGLFSWLEDHPLKNDFFIKGKQDLQLLHFIDDPEEMLAIVQKT